MDREIPFKIDIVGRGNVGSHLAKAFEGKHDVKVIDARTLEALRPDSELYLISVPDRAIREVALHIKEKLPENAPCIVAHTSGTTGMDVLEGMGVNHGVLYPLQTFSKDVPIEDYSHIPFLIEGDGEKTESTLTRIARSVSNTVLRMDSGKRRKLHVAAVFACNFTNHLWALADGYMEREGMDFTLLKPLIAETTRKMMELRHPGEGQTGPAVRRDEETMRKHETMLEKDQAMLELYRKLSESIMNINKL